MSEIYCTKIKKKKKTEDIDPTYVRSKKKKINIRSKIWVMWNNSITICERKKGGKFDIHKAMLPLFKNTS